MPETPVGHAAGAGATAHVVLPGPLDAQRRLDGDPGHHLGRVRRLRVGETVTVADGDGRWRRYAVTAVGRGTVDLAADGDEHVEPVPVPPLTVACAVGKAGKPDAVVTDLTELGIDRIVLFHSDRSVVRWDPARQATARQRLAAAARAAAGQCRRSRLPEIVVGAGIADLAGFGTIVLGAPDGGPARALGDPGPTGWCAVVGAEGGLTPGERATLLATPGAVTLAVGPAVLRTETAATAVGAVLAAAR